MTIPRKRGFTLAEVLITLGIIGVVAAITIPALISNYQISVNKTKLKKVVSILNQVGQMSKEKYDFDYSGMTRAYVDPITGSCNDNPDTTTSFCAMINGTLTNTQYYGSRNYYTITKSSAESYSPFNFRHQAWSLAEGAIIAIDMDRAKNCTLELGQTINADWISTHVGCLGYIDVNGAKRPNKEVSCSDGKATSFIPDKPCIVKKDKRFMTDVYPIVFHDSTVEPATNAAAYILKQ